VLLASPFLRSSFGVDRVSTAGGVTFSILSCGVRVCCLILERTYRSSHGWRTAENHVSAGYFGSFENAGLGSSISSAQVSLIISFVILLHCVSVSRRSFLEQERS
jgi:hypothetical protein